MKQILLALYSLLAITSLSAQVPNAINYQAVARNNAGVALANQTIAIRLSILDAGMEPFYKETRTVTTNLLGLFNVQIGSAGANNVLGSLQEIPWIDGGNLFLKVELDISNSGLFAEMGTQQLITVPYAFASREASNTKSIGGTALASNLNPAVGDKLQWNGSAWSTIKKDTTISGAGVILAVPATPGGSAPWIFSGFKQVVLEREATISAMATGVYGHINASSVPVSVSLCYQNILSGEIIPFYPSNFTEPTIAPAGNKTLLTAVGAVTLPPGTYKIGLAIRNKSTTLSLGANDYYNLVLNLHF